MTKIHTVPIHIGDFITDTMHLTAAEFGAYMRLIFVHYRLGKDGIPDDDIQLRRITGLDPKTWKSSRETILGFFDLSGNRRWVHGRVQKAIVDMERVRGHNRDKALKRWKPDDAAALQQHQSGNATAMQSIIHNPISISQDSLVARGDFEKIMDVGLELLPMLATKDSSHIRMWLNSGCEADTDIIPTIRRLSVKNPTSWAYFTNAVMDAKATRTTQPPPGTPRYSGAPQFVPEPLEETIKRMRAKGKIIE